MAAILDPAKIEKMRASAGPMFTNELVETFLADAPVMLAEIRAAWEDRSAAYFHRTARALHKQAELFGADELAENAREFLKGMPDTYDPLARSRETWALTAREVRRLCNMKQPG
jgi:HPt (histidine-containing phosphotransfer) domain-containing protein